MSTITAFFSLAVGTARFTEGIKEAENTHMWRNFKNRSVTIRQAMTPDWKMAGHKGKAHILALSSAVGHGRFLKISPETLASFWVILVIFGFLRTEEEAPAL